MWYNIVYQLFVASLLVRCLHYVVVDVVTTRQTSQPKSVGMLFKNKYTLWDTDTHTHTHIRDDRTTHTHTHITYNTHFARSCGECTQTWYTPYIIIMVFVQPYVLVRVCNAEWNVIVCFFKRITHTRFYHMVFEYLKRSFIFIISTMHFRQTLANYLLTSNE